MECMLGLLISDRYGIGIRGLLPVLRRLTKVLQETMWCLKTTAKSFDTQRTLGSTEAVCPVRATGWLHQML